MLNLDNATSNLRGGVSVVRSEKENPDFADSQADIGVKVNRVTLNEPEELSVTVENRKSNDYRQTTDNSTVERNGETVKRRWEREEEDRVFERP